MQAKKLLLSVSAVTGFALGAIGLWLTELLWKSGWDQFSWLWSSQNAIFGINLLIVLSYLTPVAVLKEISWKKLWMPALELYFITLIVFFITKSIVYSLFLPIPVFELSPYLLWVMLGTLVLTSASSFYYLTRNHLYPVRIAFIPVMIGSELLAAVCSLLAAYFILEQSTVEKVLMASIKAGFPFFFITLFIGLFSILSIKKLPLRDQGNDQEEILDDMMM